MVRKKVGKSGASHNRGNSEQDVATPWEFIQQFEKRFGMLICDLAATAENAKAPRYITPEQDSLVTEWPATMKGEYLWLNPRFGNIKPWAEKCAEVGGARRKIAMLVPAAVGANWYRDYVYRRAREYYLNGRIKFVGATHGYPKDLMLVLYGQKPGRNIWRWREGMMW